MKGNDYSELLPNMKQIAPFTYLLLHWFPVDVSRIVVFADIFLGPVVRVHCNSRAFRSTSLVTFLFYLQHVFNLPSLPTVTR